MSNCRAPLIVALIFMAGLLGGCGASEDDASLLAQARTIFGTIPERMPGSENDTAAQVALGKRLYLDTAISVNGRQSCNSCHPVDGGRAGVDNLPTSPGAMGKPGTRNTPTVLNAGFHTSQFWDGRAADLVEQAKGPILNPDEMAMPGPDHVVTKVRLDPTYADDFARAFPGDPAPLTFDNVAKAIAAFERTLVTRDRFDTYLAGDTGALSDDEKRGLRLFINTGCISCHRGPMVGAELLQKVGVFHPYENDSDVGRMKVTGRAGDKFVFKVPSLRNVSLTGPYFHDGRIGTLPEAVEKMAWLQLDRKLTQEERDLIVRFLATLADANLAPQN
ncbi:MAG: cytochrome-c peroxidase [Thermoanaerobaculia bacterium]